MFRFSHHSHHPRAAHGPHHGGGGGRGRGPKMFDAGAMRYIVLQLISEKPRHGYEIIKELEQRSGGGYTPSHGAIYPLLSMLLDMGHVVAAPDATRSCTRSRRKARLSWPRTASSSTPSWRA